ncbi:MAG: sec-independent protein translocase protein TatC [Solirubrobacteraceae bacterium]|nr:sec-independent protein translocase protein TatC [Solirubrobacteraceae bacterium]
MPALRPIGHEDRLSLVDHLDELRTRIIWSIVVFAVSFSVCYWQNDRVLNIVNRPVEQALKPGSHPKDQLGQTSLFQKRLGDLARSLGPALGAVERSAASPADKAAIAKALTAAKAAAEATPTNTARRPITLGVTEPFITTFKVAGYAAILLALPFLLFQLYGFVLPAFTPRERRAITPVLLMIPALFIAGVAFGYFVALPRAATFLLNFNEKHFDILLRAQDYYSFSIMFLAAMGLMFQVPMGVLALTRLGIVSVAQLRKNRGYVVLGVAIIAAVATPTPDPITMIITMLPLLLLFELSILGASLLERRRAVSEALDDDDDLLTDDD